MVMVGHLKEKCSSCGADYLVPIVNGVVGACCPCPKCGQQTHDWSYDSHNRQYCKRCGFRSGLGRVLVVTAEMYSEISLEELKERFPSVHDLVSSLVDSGRTTQAALHSIRLFQIPSAAHCRAWLGKRQFEDGEYYVLTVDGAVNDVAGGHCFGSVNFFMGEQVSAVLEQVGVAKVAAIIKRHLFKPGITIVPFDETTRAYARTCFQEGL